MIVGEPPGPSPLVRPFPTPARLVTLAYRELDIAAAGTDEQRKALGDVSKLPRPWDVASCSIPGLRAEVWSWLDAVVTWLNHEYVFDPVDIIPACWPQHAHLAHEIGVLADQRRRAGHSFTSDALEEWHRYGLPAFLERMRHRVADHCSSGHPATWPSAGRFNRHLANRPNSDRQRAFASDVIGSQADRSGPKSRPRLRLVDETTGEILD